MTTDNATDDILPPTDNATECYMTPERAKQLNKMLWEEKAIIYHPVKNKGFCNITKQKRFNSWTFKGSGSKNLLKQFMAYNPEYKCIAQILDFNGHRQFIPYKNWQNCWDAYIHAAYRKRYLSELILSDNYCKPYLDIEWLLAENEKSYEKDYTNFISKLKNDIILIFNKRYNLTITDEHILIAECHRDNKVSFHVILNIIIDNSYYAFKTNRRREQQSAWDLFIALIDHDNNYKNKIDEAVYSLDREFRAIYSVKYGGYTAFKPLNCSASEKFCANYLDYFITHFDTKYSIKQIVTPPYINPQLEKIKHCFKISDIKKGHHVKDYNSIYNDVEHKEIVDKIMELLQFIHPTAYFTGLTTDNKGYRFSYSNKDELCFTGHTHKNNGFSVYVKPSDGNIYMFCYSNKCNRLYKLGNLHIDTLWNIEALRINNKFLDYKTEIKYDLFEHEDLKLSGTLNKFINNGGNYVIKSNMGTGKTQLLKTILKMHFNDKRILYLSHRQTFTHNIDGSFKELGFYNYLNGLEDIEKHDKLIIQIDSLVHLVNIYGKLKYYDFIVLDEVESLLCHLSSPTLANKRTLVCLVLDQLIKNAKWVLSMDADFSNRSYDFLSKIKCKPNIIINDYVSIKKKFLFTHNYDARCHQLIEDIKNKKNIAIICLSKSTVDDIYNKIKDIKNIKVIRYTSMTDDEQKTALSNVNKEWVKYNVVLYSPTIEAGVDFNVVHFNKIYCFLSSGSCCPRSFLQMVGRIRTITDDRIRCCYDKLMKYVNKNAYIPTIDTVEDMIVKRDYLYNNYTFNKVNDTECELVIKKDAFTRTFAYNYVENYEKQIKFMSTLKELIVQREWEYLNEDAGERDEVENNVVSNSKTDHKSVISTDSSRVITEVDIGFDNEIKNNSTTATTKKTIELDELLISPFINDKEAKEYDILKVQNLLTRTQKLSLKKYWILKKFKLEPEDLNMDFLLDWYGKEYILDNVAYALGKKKLNDINDPYLNNIRLKLEYLHKILKVYGFKHLFDFETVAEKDDNMDSRMLCSKLLEATEYKKIMLCFGKRLRGNINNFSLSKYIKITDVILNDFGIGLKCIRIRQRTDNDRIYIIKYKLIENICYITNLYSVPR